MENTNKVTHINQAIVAYEVVKPELESATVTEHCLEQVHENLDRPEHLPGATYKIKTPMSDHALYVTVNDILLNEGTEHEQRHPYEVFINSKNMDDFQWIVALTRVISAVFRKGGDVTFLVEELKAVFDPKGGYFKKGGRFMPSLVAEIGYAIESHLQAIGLMQVPTLSPEQQAMVDQKSAQLKELTNKTAEDNGGGSSYPASASLCAKCHTKAKVVLDGCATCLSCGDSKCG
jgi:hypothetical protein